jgi:DNA (cytosine-5)-methyltransferase 1
MIMGFPITYEFYGSEGMKWRQVGNAVCVQLSFSLANKVKELLNITLPAPKEIKKDLSLITFLDNPREKTFDKPPKRNPSSLFRTHPIKSGNVTVDLTNRAGEGLNDWQIIAHTGTGDGYNSTPITKSHHEAARALVAELYPGFIKIVEGDSTIKPYSKSVLDDKNRFYGYISTDINHPYNIVKRISSYITSTLSDSDPRIDTTNSVLREVKSTLPMSQAMSIYALGKLIHKETNI